MELRFALSSGFARRSDDDDRRLLRCAGRCGSGLTTFGGVSVAIDCSNASVPGLSTVHRRASAVTTTTPAKMDNTILRRRGGETPLIAVSFRTSCSMSKSHRPSDSSAACRVESALMSSGKLSRDGIVAPPTITGTMSRSWRARASRISTRTGSSVRPSRGSPRRSRTLSQFGPISTRTTAHEPRACSIALVKSSPMPMAAMS